MEIIIFCVIGLAAGVLSGLLGIGGGILIVPCLVAFMGFTQKKAQGTSLVALLAPVGLLALMNYYKDNNADLKAGMIIATTFFFGAYIGSKFGLSLSDNSMRKVFAVFLGVVSVYMFTKK